MRLDECRSLDDLKEFKEKVAYGTRNKGFFHTIKLHPENISKGLKEVVQTRLVDASKTVFLVDKNNKFTWRTDDLNQDLNLPLFTDQDEAFEHGTNLFKKAFQKVTDDLDNRMKELGKKEYK